MEHVCGMRVYSKRIVQDMLYYAIDYKTIQDEMTEKDYSYPLDAPLPPALN